MGDFFDKFREFVSIEGKALGAGMMRLISPAIAERLGVRPITWGEAARAEQAGPTAGIPEFYLWQEKMLRGMMGAGGTIAGQEKMAEWMYKLQVQQFEMATTPEARMTQFEEAATAFNQFMELNLRTASDQYQIQLDQLEQLKRNVEISELSRGKLMEIVEQIREAVGLLRTGRQPLSMYKIEELNPLMIQ